MKYYNYKDEMVIEGTRFEVSPSMTEGLEVGSKINIRFKDGELTVDSNGAECTVVSSRNIGFTDRKEFTLEITRVSPLFVSKYSVDAGYNTGECMHSDSPQEVLRLNDVFGRGSIYKKVRIFGAFLWVQVGWYNLRTDFEKLENMDEEELQLELLTRPKLIENLLGTLHL